MKTLNIFLLVLLISLFTSCKKCRTCTCYKPADNTGYNEKECLYTNDADNDFRQWQQYIMKENGYEKCDCFDSNGK